MKTHLPSDEISQLPGVGKTRKEQLNKLGITTIKDLLFYFPRFYENRSNISTVSSALPDAPVSFILTVASEVKTASIRKGMTISKFKAFDETGAVEILFFNSQFVKNTFHTGSVFRFYGKLSVSKNKLQLINPKYDPYVQGAPLQGFVPIYPLTAGISSKIICKLMEAALKDTIAFIDDPLPDDIRIEHSLPVLSYAIKNIHFPESEVALKNSIRRLAFDEMLYFALGVAGRSYFKKKSIGFSFSKCDLSPLLNLLPYELTSSQKDAVNDIYKDTVHKNSEGKTHPMSRIIVGDVGCGKTICAILAIFIAVKSGYQAALMAPTEILARQHFLEIDNLFSKLGIKAELLIGSTKPKEKEKIYSSLSSGELPVVVGTHALLSKKVSFNKLGLIITDEQHRFGVNQRAVLKERSALSHMLVMSATPIPRTLALTLYGDLDVSRITEMPSGRQRVDTFVVDESYRQRLNDFIEKQVRLGGQCYVVCPAIEPTEETETDAYEIGAGYSFSNAKSKYSNVKNSVEFAEFLKQNLRNCNVASLHGKMKSKEKDEIMKAFAEHKIDVLVSTTVIEVGVNVPNASLMIIENAERFGLSQLHQLRGRVGRGSRKSYCILVQGTKSEKSSARLEIMRTTYNGFEIAERDLMERGPGDFFSTLSDTSEIRQSGGFQFKMASLSSDAELMSEAFVSAKKIISEDPLLTLVKNSLLREEVSSLQLSDFSTIS